MPKVTSGDAEIVYDDINPEGAKGAIVLVHGFASNRNENWNRTGWYTAFEAKGRRVIAMDHRGHGESTKFHDPNDYLLDKLRDDVMAVIADAGVEKPDIMGYSMGAGIALRCVIAHPDAFSNAIIGGIGTRAIDPEVPSIDLAAAMETDDPSSITDPTCRGFRMFADQQGEDRLALGAFCRTPHERLLREDLAEIRIPTLFVYGQLDKLVDNPQDLVDAVPGAKSAMLPGCNHMSAIPHPLYKAAVMDFLEGWLDV